VATYGGATKTAGIGRTGAPQFELQDRADGARHTLFLKGELDMACSPLLDEILREVCVDSTEDVVLDMSRLTFMDSTGLRSILLAEELCQGNGCKLALIPGPRQVQRLFELTGLIDRLPFGSADDSSVTT
jgi:anti-sigma B factor antagonist